ncbi:hypothetical protein ymoll0001_7660 [Yersinia mollaretii ATCC 43969]|uniref:Intimin n=2 Tax=Yersinia mollaretii TaxID=33060 RepID=A0ABP2EE53_YERMW|nr:hypothetical protein ymoll0001_7660 [Yersinia mollaretii ATCC 43969]
MSFSTHADSGIAKKTALFKRLHTLTATDTLESVASGYGLSVDELWALNINLYNNRVAFDAIKYGAVVYVPNREEEQKATQQASLVASHLSQIGSTLSSESRVEAFSRLAKGVLLSSTAKSVEEWLGHIGKAQVKLQVDDKNDFSGSELHLFVPLYNQPERLAFSQFGFRRIDQRNIMNIGLGQRHYLSDWMLGYNVFLDQQISGNAHRRLGLGGELARDYVKLSANSYYRLGGWKNSTRLEDYDERAASGYDIRTEAYLPYYPQLGGKLMYEQYFGNEVALFGLNERQKNPSALTASVSYTPFPLVNLALEHTIGNSGKNKTGVNLAVNYEINTPWQKQIDPAAVKATRTLAGSRMDLVDRNNNIVLEYRKQQVVTLNLPAKVSGKEKQVLPINYTFNARHGLDRIEWDAADVINAGGNISDQGNLAYHITFPPYIDGGDNAYVLAGRAVDKKGNYSVSNSTNIYVTGVNINSVKSTITLTPATLPANATSRSTLQLKLNTDAGNAVSGAARQITFAVRDVSGNVPRARSFAQPVVIADAQEIQTGVYETSVTSGNLVGRFEITPTVRGVQLNPIILTQSADATTATINGSANITISTPTITANATDKTHLEVLVTDALGHPVPGVEVTWVSDLNSPGLEHVTSITNEHGIAENNFTSTTAGTANITVQTGTSPPVQAGTIEIKPDKVNRTTFKADETDQVTYTAKVVDINNNPLENFPVSWRLTQGEGQYKSLSYTGPTGEAETKLSASRLGQYKMEAQIGILNGSPTRIVEKAAPDVSTTAGDIDPSKSDLVVDVNSIDASGKTKAKLTATLKDKFGNLLKGQTVNVKETQNLTGIKFSVNPMKDNGDGTYSTEVTSTTKGNTTFIASINSVDLTQQPQMLVGNIIPQLSFDNKNEKQTYRKTPFAKQALKGLPQSVIAHWNSDNSDVAKIDPATGEIKLLKAGVVNISAVTLADNTYAMGTASYQLEVERADPKLNFTKRFSNVTWGQVAAKEQPNVGNSDWANSQPQLKWSSSEPNVAKVDANGNITLLKAGDTSIKATTAQTDQFKAAEAEYVLNINKANLQLSFNASVKQYSVDSKPSNVQSLILPTDLPASAVRWSSSNPSAMNIDSNGRVSGVSAGDSNIKIEIDKNDFYAENSAKYLAEVYQKPSVSISSTNTVSKGVSGSNSSEWKPAFKGDQMAVNWRVSGSGKFAGPKKVVVQFIEDGSGSKLFEKESTSNLASGSTVIEDTNVKNLVGKRGKFVVKTEGTSGLSSQDQTKIIDVKRLYPDEIWNKVRVKSGHSIYEKGKSVKDCRTSAGFWNDTHHVNLNWGVGIDLGNNQLLEGMEVKLRIDKVSSSYISPKDIVTRNILKTFDEVSTPSSNYIAETLHTDCYDPHNDSVELVLDVEYLGKKTMYKAGSVYWEGLGRTKKDFVEANIQRK